MSVAPPPDEPTSVSDERIPKPPPFHPPGVTCVVDVATEPLPPT